jgi:hypothetical protein
VQGTLVLEKIFTEHGVVHFRIVPKKEGELVNGSRGKDMIEIPTRNKKKVPIRNLSSKLFFHPLRLTLKVGE